SLSSQWPFERSVNYLLNIILCRIFRTRHIIMPQSIGPFKYKFLEKAFLFPLFKLHLPYSDIIYARESQGLREAGRFSFRNLRLSPDLVLLSGPYSREVYPSPKGKIVGIVPSRQLLKYTSRALLTDIYSRAVKYLLNMGNEVLLIVHSKEDMGIALEVFRSADSDKVRITADDLSGQSLEKQIAACDYIIASRYHSMVHAYRSGTPVIALGWAIKYSELMKIFHQNIYYMDIANILNREQICDMIDQMEKNHFNESEIIRKMLRRICLSGDKHPINFIKDASS
ncbi:polysaccharide pyruvyl transferase family protein, partial [bacterium]|nr:polysaccharide pyruvyl transferase family protein [bacterium]